MVGNTWLKKLLDPQSYGLAIVVAIILHVVVIALFAIEWPKEKRQLAEPTPKNIQAKVIQTESKYSKQQKLAAEKRRKDENWKKYLADKKAAKKKVAQEKAAKDKARRDEAARNKAKSLADKKKADEKKKKDIKKEQLKKKELAEQKAFEQAQEQSLMKALAEEQQQRSIEKAMAEEQQMNKNAEITNDVAAQIRAKISKVWRYPPSARPDMEVVVRIQLVPTGEVINVSIISGSGNEALDRSVLAAVSRAQPLPVPKETRLFEQQFRSFVMAFRPEDAVW
ncbi:MAG: colicin import membrane protein [Oleispira sp.]|jgi:colicin import membrane protein